MDWIVYSVNPIDFGWENLKTVRETLVEIAGSDDEFTSKHDINEDQVASFLQSWESAKNAATREGWEGDFRIAPRVFWLPSELGFDHGFVFKQDNNGTTFVVSPQELPTMARLAS